MHPPLFVGMIKPEARLHILYDISKELISSFPLDNVLKAADRKSVV